MEGRAETARTTGPPDVRTDAPAARKQPGRCAMPLLSEPPLVVGVDGSPASGAAITWAARRAALTGTRVHLVHAFAPDMPLLGFGEVQGHDVIRGYAEELLTAATARVHAVSPDVEVTTSVSRGFASAALIATSHDAVAIVVGTTGQGLLSRFSVGAVAVQVATHAACPVVLVGDQPGETGDQPRVLVGVDGSDSSLRALEHAAREARTEGATLDVVHVWQARGESDPTLETGSSWPEYTARVGAVVTRTLGHHRAGDEPTVEVLRGDPVRRLAERSAGASLLVVGSRGTGGFPGLHLGATALGLLSRAQCPLALVR